MGEKGASYFVFPRNVPTARRESAGRALKVLIIKRTETMRRVIKKRGFSSVNRGGDLGPIPARVVLHITIGKILICCNRGIGIKLI